MPCCLLGAPLKSTNWPCFICPLLLLARMGDGADESFRGPLGFFAIIVTASNAVTARLSLRKGCVPLGAATGDTHS